MGCCVVGIRPSPLSDANLQLSALPALRGATHGAFLEGRSHLQTAATPNECAMLAPYPSSIQSINRPRRAELRLGATRHWTLCRLTMVPAGLA
jgi:hypothetical protein